MKLIFLILCVGIVFANDKVFDVNFTPAQLNSYLKSGYFKGYFTVKEFWDFLSDLRLKPEYRKIVSRRISLGTTVQGNKIYGFYITDDVSQLEANKRTKNILMFTSLHHSREPLTITMIILMVAEITKNFMSRGHSSMKELLRDNMIMFIPTLNVDSYLYITNMYRQGKATEPILMIRKNRNILGACSDLTGGVDLNRNYSYKFGMDNQGSSDNPCAEDYRGPTPFSERETQAIKKYVEGHHNIVSCVNLHSYGNAWIYPFNYLADHSDHYLEVSRPLFFNFYKEFETEMQRKGRKAHFGNSALVLDYPSNGEAGDWLTGAKKILNLEVELGNDSRLSERFYPPKNLIPKIVRYNWIIMRDYLHKHIISLDLQNIYVEKINQPRVVFEIFNSSVSSLRDVVIELKALFPNNEDVKYRLEYSIKALPGDAAPKGEVRGRQLPMTFEGRHILEVDVVLNNLSDIKKVVALDVTLMRNEGNYLGYPKQKYVFKVQHQKNN